MDRKLPPRDPSHPFVGGTPIYPAPAQTFDAIQASGATDWTTITNIPNPGETGTLPIVVTGSLAAGNLNVSHAASGVTAGTYGDATHIPQITVEADGHATSILSILAPYMPLAGGTFTGTITTDGINYNVVLVNDTDYQLTGNEDIVIWTAITAVRFLKLPTGIPLGHMVQVWDGSGHVLAGSIEIQISGNVGVTYNNGLTGCCPLFINNPQGVGYVVSKGSNTFYYIGNMWPLWFSSSVNITYNGGAHLGGMWTFQNPSGIGASIFGSSLGIHTTSTSISATLTLTNASENFQAINGGAADRIVNLPFTNGNFFWIWNTGTTNNLLVTANSALVYALPPGQAAFFSYNGAAFEVWNGTGPLFQRKSDLTAQAAAQSGTALLTTASNGNGMYRVSYSATLTQAATASSTLGGFSVTYTDNDTGASVTTPVGPTSTANTVGTQLNGTVLVNAKVSTAITFSFGYASSGATAMQYALHVRSEFLG